MVDIQARAEERITGICERFLADSNESEVLLAAMDWDETWADILAPFDAKSPAVQTFLNYVVDKFEAEEERKSSGYAISIPKGVIARSILVGAAAAALGASVGISGVKLDSILTGIVGAEAAVLLNVLAALLSRSTN